MTLRFFRKADTLFVLLLALACAGLMAMPTGFEAMQSTESLRAKGLIMSVDNTNIRTNLIVKTGAQHLDTRILTGPFKGRTTEVVNQLKGVMHLDELYAPGQKILLEFATDEDGSIQVAYARGKYRLGVTYLLLGLFSLLLVAVAGFTGLKALLSFVFAVLMLWKVMFPAFLKGYDPIWTALWVCAALVGAVCFLVGGINRKGLVAFLGSFLGLALTCCLAVVFTGQFGISGAVLPFSETLLYSGYPLDLTRMFMAGIFLASSGALMDLSMDISASMHEVALKRPEIGIGEHIASGLAVGRMVVGTMTTTLLLAYSGGYTALMMLFMAQGVPLENIFNLNHVSAEVLYTLVGSFGMVTVAPFTAIAGGFVHHWRPANGSAVEIMPARTG
jgi:uncharacterized membrane protein